MNTLLVGRTWKLGDDIDTDRISPGQYIGITDPVELARHVLEGVALDFPSRLKPGDILVAGGNFGCGSSRERAPVAIQGAGVSCIIARSFARIFLRNAINIGLPIIVCPPAVNNIEEGDEVEVDLAAGAIRNRRTGEQFTATPFPAFLQQIIGMGGLLAYARQSGAMSPRGNHD